MTHSFELEVLGQGNIQKHAEKPGPGPGLKSTAL